MSLGQGEELSWTRDPRPLRGRDVIEVFRMKTAPAFRVALRMGALLAGADDPALTRILETSSEAVGIAYQIRDDLEDVHLEQSGPPRSTLPLAIGWERFRGERRDQVAAAFRGESAPGLARLLDGELEQYDNHQVFWELRSPVSRTNSRPNWVG